MQTEQVVHEGAAVWSENHRNRSDAPDWATLFGPHRRAQDGRLYSPMVPRWSAWPCCPGTGSRGGSLRPREEVGFSVRSGAKLQGIFEYGDIDL
jgi:hypothetical protein